MGAAPAIKAGATVKVAEPRGTDPINTSTEYVPIGNCPIANSTGPSIRPGQARLDMSIRIAFGAGYEIVLGPTKHRSIPMRNVMGESVVGLLGITSIERGVVCPGAVLDVTKPDISTIDMTSAFNTTLPP